MQGACPLVLDIDQWSLMGARFCEWGAPLRPSREDVFWFSHALSSSQRTLLLGVTKELQVFASQAIDNNPSMVASAPDLAILGDWRDMPFEQKFDAVIGDGCLNVVQSDPALFFSQLQKVLKPKGKIVLRVFIAPEKRESLEEVFQEKDKMGFHAFKWRVAHALADPYVPVQKIYDAIFPIWPHPTLQVYQNSSLLYYFPKLSDLFSFQEIAYSSSYELAARCPIVSWIKD